MRLAPEFKQALERILAGSQEGGDLEVLRRALQAGQITLATGEQAVAIGGNADDVILVTGENNIVVTFNGPNAEAIQRILALPPMLSKDLIRLTKEYLQAVKNQWQFLRFDEDSEPIPLQDVFVMLYALQNDPRPRVRGDRSDLPPGMEKRREHAGILPEKTPSEPPREPPRPVALGEAMQKSLRLVLLGEPGAGKSTTLQFIGLCFACHGEEWVKEKLNLEEVRIPVLLRLSDLDPISSLRTALDKRVADILQCSTVTAAALVRDWGESGQLMFLLDGLDEAPNGDATRQAIEAFVASPLGRDVRLVVSSRPAGYLSLSGNFQEYVLKPFEDPTEAQTFLAKWLSLLKKKDAEGEAKYLLEKLLVQPALSRLTDNPLLLRLCAEVFAEQGDVVHNRAELYREYLTILCKRAVRRGLKDGDTETALNIAALLAWRWQVGGSNTETDVIQILQMDKYAQSESEAKYWLKVLHKRMGLFICESGRYSFSHQTLREYFVAQRLEQAWKRDAKHTWRFIRPRLHHPEWREPVLLLAGMLDETGSTKLVRNILEADSLYERKLHRDLLLAGECLYGVIQLEAKLKHTLLERLIRLYLEGIENLESNPNSIVFQKLVQSIEIILGSLNEESRNEILLYLITIVRKEDKSESIISRMIMMGLITLEIVSSSLAFLVDVVRRPRILHIPPFDFRHYYFNFLFPKFLSLLPVEMAASWQRAAIIALGNLRFGNPEIISLLLEALHHKFLWDVAAEVLGKVGPGTIEVVTALLDAQQRYKGVHGFIGGDKIAEALGVLGQRNNGVVEKLLEMVSGSGSESNQFNVHYLITWVICKAAETNLRAMAFVLEGKRRLSEIEMLSDGTFVKVLDDGVREGLKDGTSKMIQSASPEVIRYLLNTIRISTDLRESDIAGEVLLQVAGNSPMVQCKVVADDSTIYYKTIDLTEEVFDLFINKLCDPIFFSRVNIAEQTLLVRWVLNRPDLMVRLINTVQKADIEIVACKIEEQITTNKRWLENIELGVIEFDENEKKRLEDAIAFLQRSITLLRHPDRNVRESEFNSWMVAARSVPKDSKFLAYHLLRAVVSRKPHILCSIYKKTCGLVWRYHEDNWSKLPVKKMSPNILAALACFRGWYTLSPLYYSLTNDEIQEEFLLELKQALSILQNPGRQALEILAPILAGEGAKIASRDIEKRLQMEDEHLPEGLKRYEDWLKNSKPDYVERCAAAYALALLADEYPEVQSLLLARLRPGSWRQGETTEFQEHLIHAMGYVKHANRDIIAALLNVINNHDEAFYMDGSEALSRLQNPSPEAVTLLIQGYKDLNIRQRANLLKALGTVDPPTKEVIALLLSALKDRDLMIRSAAAEGLGNLKEVDSKVVDALLTCAKHTIAAADAIVRLADRIKSSNRVKVQAQLVRVAKTLWGFTHRKLSWYDYFTYRSGYDVVYEGLIKVVSRITELKVAALPAGLPPFNKDEMVKGNRSSLFLIVSIITSVILGLVSNIVAAYMQEQYHFINEPIRFMIVLVVFLISLAVHVGLTLRAGKPK